MAYASDADAMFVVEDSERPDATRIATQVVTELRSALAKAGPDPSSTSTSTCDPKARTVRWCARSRRIAPTTSGGRRPGRRRCCCGPRTGGRPAAVGRPVAGGGRAALPARGHHPAAGPRDPQAQGAHGGGAHSAGSDPLRNTKLGPGGLSDVEWVVQLLQLVNAGRLRELRTTSTLPALAAAERADLISADDAVALRDAWTMASALRNAILLLRGRASDTIGSDPGRCRPWPSCSATTRANPASCWTNTGAVPGTPGR